MSHRSPRFDTAGLDANVLMLSDDCRSFCVDVRVVIVVVVAKLLMSVAE